jgi:alanyl-tRNA synthetase
MLQRNYYLDAYTTQFQAEVFERVRENGRLAVILDQTYFYPASGGQPADHGFIDGVPVVDVTIRERDGAVCHWLGKGELWQDTVNCEIDWIRRFDHMQQHTGQHILSQAFIQTANAPTVSFHLSENRVTIDLEAKEIQPAQVEKAEFMANQIIWQNRPVHIRMVSPAEAEKLPLRKIPPAHNGQLRLIEIEKFDLTACGGTHVRQAGAVGLIKVTKLERHRGKLRVEFCCGQRALRDYRLKNGVVNQLSNALTTSATAVLPAVEKLQETQKTQKKELKTLQSTITALEANSLLEHAEPLGKTARLITHIYDGTDADPGKLRAVANQVTGAADNVVIMLGLTGARSHLLFARAANAPGSMDQLIKPALQMLNGAGGGSDMLAQGGGGAADAARITAVLTRSKRILQGQVK